MSFLPELPPSAWFSWLPLIHGIEHILLIMTLHWYDPWSWFHILSISALLFMLHDHCNPEFTISSCWLSPWGHCDVPQYRFSFLFFAWHLMCNFNSRRRGLYSIWENPQLSSFPVLLAYHSLSAVLFGCPWLCSEEPQSSMPQSCPFQFLSLCASLLVDVSIIFSISPILSAASICLELIQLVVFHLFQILCFTFLKF